MGSQLMGHSFVLTLPPPFVDNNAENGLDMTH